MIRSGKLSLKQSGVGCLKASLKSENSKISPMKEIMKSELMNEMLMSNESLLNKDDENDFDEKR
jgi:hypothetical protein